VINKKRLIDEFISLVQIDSESGNERAICDFLKAKLESMGLCVVEDRSAIFTKHGAGNLVATFMGSVANAPTIYFTSHMDTVAPGKRVKPSILGDYIVTDGTTVLGSDDKAGIAAIVEGIQIIREMKIPHGNLQFVFTVGEESGLLGARHLDRTLVDAEYGFAFDAGGQVGEIITSAPAQVKIEAKIRGKAAHAGSNPESGISAIQVASQAISRMKLGRIDAETTANIGMFQGGIATNVVPEYVKISAEARSRDQKKLVSQVENMVLAFEQTAEQMGAKAEVETKALYPGYLFTKEDLVVRKAIAGVKKVGRTPHLGVSGGGSDANVLAGYGIPTVNLSIGYEYIHTTNERMSIPELVKAAELVVALVEESIR
jgi:tripeptide aminopeptidase